MSTEFLTRNPPWQIVRAYLGYMRLVFLRGMAYRAEVWGIIISQLPQIFVAVTMWWALYRSASGNEIAGVTVEEMVTYILLTHTLRFIVHFNELADIGNHLRKGDISIDLVRPVNYHLFLWCERLGNIGVGFLFRTVPLVVVGSLAFGIRPPAGTGALVAFLISVLLALTISFLITYASAIASFWFMSSYQFTESLRGIVRLFGGSFVPLWFYPASLRTIAEFLPFRFTFYVPAAVYLGKIPLEEVASLAWQGVCWIILLSLAIAVMWRRAIHNIVVHGG